jgi:small subunit ribosomal protein S19
MSRSQWKGPFFSQEIFKLLSQGKSKFFFIKRKSMVIIPEFIGKNIKVYNGCKFIDLWITTDMVGHKIGEFLFTRVLHVYKKKS